MTLAIETVGLVYPSSIHADPEAQMAAAERLRAAFPELTVVVEPWADTPEQRTRRGAPDYERGAGERTPVSGAQKRSFGQMDAMLALDLPFDVTAMAPRLVWVQSVGTGVAQLRSSGLDEAGVLVTNAAGTSATEISEFILARILQHVKRLPLIDRLQADRTWEPVYGSSLAGRTIGLVGFGAINRRVAALAAALDMRVRVCRRAQHERPDVGIEAVFGPEELTTMLGSCDIVVAALPETAATHDLFDRTVFSAMKQGAFFCNVGRGSAVVDEHLLEALASGHLGGAALDVFRTEPLDPTSPLWAADNVAVSAHCASNPDAAIERVLDLFSENLRRLRSGRAPLNAVNVNAVNVNAVNVNAERREEAPRSL